MATLLETDSRTAIRPHPPILLAGPTAVGKSEIALVLAEKIGGEIISVDSMQVYRGLDIGTAKPTVAERQRVPHHLIDVVDLHESFDAAQFIRRAHTAVQEIQARERVPILCGGTGLYFNAFLNGLGDAPPANAALRAELNATPVPELLRELEQRDPATFQIIDRQNPRRVVRALEVIRETGKPFSAQRADWKSSSQTASAQPASRFFCFKRSNENLRVRSSARVDWMFKNGLVEETKKLLEHGLAENQTAMQAIGYRQVVEHLRGERSLAATIELVKIRTRQFAKRQMTWFRRQTAPVWIELSPTEEASSVVAQMMAQFQND